MNTGRRDDAFVQRQMIFGFDKINVFAGQNDFISANKESLRAMAGNI